jgi:hypothetical protein
MSMKVGSLDSVAIGRFQYIFIIVVWDDYVSPIRSELEKQSEAFGADLAEKGLVVRAFDNANGHVSGQLLDKNWPDEMKRKLDGDQEPLMVIIRTDFESFDPRSDPWAVLWFSQWEDSPETIYRVFRLLADKSNADEDVFHYVARLSKKRKFKKWVKYLELKPNFQGIGININALLEDRVAT